MAFKVRLDSPALSYLKRLDRSTKERIARRIDQLLVLVLKIAPRGEVYRHLG